MASRYSNLKFHTAGVMLLLWQLALPQYHMHVVNITITVVIYTLYFYSVTLLCIMKMKYVYQTK